MIVRFESGTTGLAEDEADRFKIARSNFPDMSFVPAGVSTVGSGPWARPVATASFWIDPTPVTNRMFANFVFATGYVTVAETPLDPEKYPAVPKELLRGGSTVFAPGRERADLRDWSNWWAFRFGACWRRPYGINSAIAGLENHPVVHIAFEDAQAFANWMGKELPTEAEWDLAAWGGRHELYPWSNELTPNALHMANTWQGTFPYENLRADGYARTSPVRAFPPYGHDVYDMMGNVWEWTVGVPFQAETTRDSSCTLSSPMPALEQQRGRSDTGASTMYRVIKGGSFLCAPESCGHMGRNARRLHPINAPACHIGFRCVVR